MDWKIMDDREDVVEGGAGQDKRRDSLRLWVEYNVKIEREANDSGRMGS